MNKVLRRIVALIPALLAQLLWLFVLLKWLAPYAALINLLLAFFAFLVVLYIITNRNESTYKTLWLLVILGLPIFGAILYLFFGNKRAASPLRKKLAHGRASLPDPAALPATATLSDPASLPVPSSSPDPAAALSGLAAKNPRLAQTFGYISGKTGFPVRPCRDAEYYPLGEKMFARMLDDLESAEHFIFAEYFIIENGKMWDSMVDIMARKVARGVDVRVMYDDLGSISTYSARNLKQLKERGIRCVRFNPMVFIRGTLNYRDHRKMLVIDGKVAFSGGINLADEYINEKVKFGHWKDIGFRLTGAPVQNYVRMFAEFWNAFSDDPIPAEKLALQERAAATMTSGSTDALAADNEASAAGAPAANAAAGGNTRNTPPYNGYVLSYYDSPLYADAASNNLYAELLSQSVQYAWFYTPYLMLGDALLDAFVRAAERGVDVRIIMPGIPDKKLVYRMSRSYYQPLLAAGVKIYEYTPGFVHAKGCVIDDEVGTIGTVNLDYRSLFLHFENNALFYQASLLKKLKADFAATQEMCRQRTLENINLNFRKWVADGILRIFAPLC